VTDSELHRSHRTGWLRAAVLGANDGIISVASLVVGVAASGATAHSVLLTGVAGLVAGTVAMAAGEYVSVQSQADTEDADIQLERRALELQPESELAELTAIYRGRGLDEVLARTVAETLMAKDALGAHSRDELGITDLFRARPLQAALASAISFGAGAMIPVATALLTPVARVATVASATALVSLLVLGGAAARVGGASLIKGAIRVAFWGALAMGLTAAVGKLFGAHV
jgi:VIT1/CCC1 family predicted Fe2+/Mn2+ transporter